MKRFVWMVALCIAAMLAVSGAGGRAYAAGCSATGSGGSLSASLSLAAGQTVTISSPSGYIRYAYNTGGAYSYIFDTAPATFTIGSAGNYSIQAYAVDSANALLWAGTMTLSCTSAATAATSSSDSIATNAKQSTQYVAPKVMVTATTAIGTLIGNNIKGAFSRVSSIQGRGISSGFAEASDPVMILAQASGTLPQANAVGEGLRKGLLDGRLGGFAEMSYSHLRSTEAGGQYDGDVKNGVAGVDYLVRRDLLVGVAGGYEWSNFNTSYNSGWLDGHGLTVAPYLGYSFDRFVLDMTVGHSWLQYDTLRGTNGPAYGSYDAERNFITSNLTATYYWRTLRIAPSAGLLFAREEAEAYTDSTGTRQAGVTSRMGRASLGGEIGHPVNLQDICTCSIEPFIKAKLNYDFLHNGQVLLANGQLSAVHDLTGQAGGGFRVTFGRYLVALIDSSYDTLGASNLYGWNVRGRLDFTFPF